MYRRKILRLYFLTSIVTSFFNFLFNFILLLPAAKFCGSTSFFNSLSVFCLLKNHLFFEAPIVYVTVA